MRETLVIRTTDKGDFLIITRDNQKLPYIVIDKNEITEGGASLVREKLKSWMKEGK